MSVSRGFSTKPKKTQASAEFNEGRDDAKRVFKLVRLIISWGNRNTEP